MVKIIYIFLILHSVTSCKVVRRIKSKILGKKSNISKELIVADESITENMVASENIVSITPRKRIFNLLRAFLDSGDMAYYTLLKKEIPHSKSLFSSLTDLNKSLLSSLNSFPPLLEAKNEQAAEILFLLYRILQGKNRVETGLVLSNIFDYMPIIFWKKYVDDIGEKNCLLVSYVPPHIKAVTKKREHLRRRRERLRGVDSSGLPFSVASTLDKCVERLNAI